MLLTQIAKWIETQKPWISDSARRIITQGKLKDSDVDEVLAMAKLAEGIEDPACPKPVVLTQAMIPVDALPGSPLKLISLGSMAGVNALAGDQKIEFAASGMTVIYGRNGAGKSGYSRVLRKACRARATGGPILGNVFSVDGKPQISAEIVVQRDGEAAQTLVWRENVPPPAELASVAVFDSHCARAFNDSEGEIAYTPRGLDVLADLAALCGKLRTRLEVEMRAITSSSADFADLLGEHEVGNLVAQFDRQWATAKYISQIEKAGVVSKEEEDEAITLAKHLGESEPAKRAADLRKLSVRIYIFAKRWQVCEATLSDDQIGSALKLGDASLAADAAARAAAAAFAAEGDLLPETGSDPWHALLKAAREFSAEAYPGHDFPHVDGARCVLCQQDLPLEAGKRLACFETFIEQKAQKGAETARAAARAAFAAFERADVAGLSDEVLAAEIDQLAPGSGERLKRAALSLVERQQVAARAWQNKNFEIQAMPFEALSPLLLERGAVIEAEAVRFDGLAKADERKRSVQRLADIQSRQRLSTRVEQIKRVASELDRKKRLAKAYAAADSGRFSRKMQQLHEEALSEDAEEAFNRECAALRIQHVPIRNSTRMDRGKAKQQAKLDTAGKEKVSDVLSEGEQRALALATFLAEVSLVPGHGAIIFDDPMSSLDDERRERVAVRLAKEANERQVIVFTHDLSFVNHLADAAQRAKAPVLAMSVRSSRTRAGIVYPELPFAGLKVAERLERVKKVSLAADEALKADDPERCDEIVRNAYGRLRETWERGVEELVLGDTVVRFRPGVATMRLRYVSLADEECAAIEEAMSRCSHFAAHDTAAEASTAVPTPDELRADVESARVFFAERRKQNEATAARRRALAERASAFKIG